MAVVPGILCDECGAAFIPDDDACACMWAGSACDDIAVDTGADGGDRIALEAVAP